MEVPIGAFRCCVWRVFYLLTFVRVSLAFNLKAENLPEDVVVISGAPEGSFTLPLMHSQVSQGPVEVALARALMVTTPAHFPASLDVFARS